MGDQPIAPIFRWTGAANMPSQFLRVALSGPFAQLTVEYQHVSIRPNKAGRFVSRLIRIDAGPADLDAAPEDLKAVYPTYSVGSTGIGFDHRDGREWYFWGGSLEERLRVIAWAGFPVDNERRKAAKVWAGVP